MGRDKMTSQPSSIDWVDEDEKKRKALVKRTVKHMLRLNQVDQVEAETIFGKRKDPVPRNVVLTGLAMIFAFIITILIISFPSDNIPPSPREGAGPAITHNPKLWYGSTSYPKELASWQKQVGPRSKEGLTSAMREHYLKTLKATPFGLTAFATLPREGEGATSDPNKLFLKDKFNVNYSSWTYESLVPQVGMLIERLLNPEVGGWKEYQYSASRASENFPLQIFGDVFSRDYLLKLEKDRRLTPVYADWESDDFKLASDLLDIKGARWLGTPSSIEGIFTYKKSLAGYELRLAMELDLAAYTQDKKVIHRKGKLDLLLHPASATDAWSVKVVDARLTTHA